MTMLANNTKLRPKNPIIDEECWKLFEYETSNLPASLTFEQKLGFFEREHPNWSYTIHTIRRVQATLEWRKENDI